MRSWPGTIDEVAASWLPDVIHGEELRTAYYLPGVRGRPVKAKQSVSIHNVESELFTKIGNPAVRFGRPIVKQIQLSSLRRYEAQAVTRTDMRPRLLRARSRAIYATLPRCSLVDHAGRAPRARNSTGAAAH